jgi:hypothetical protein
MQTNTHQNAFDSHRDYVQPSAPVAEIQTLKPAGNLLVGWAVAWLGISASGGTFGLVVATGDPAGAVIGSIIAGVVGAAVVVTIGVITWAFWLLRYRIVWSIVAGVLSGVIPALPLPLNELAITVAGIFGGVGGGLAGYLYWKNRPPFDSSRAVDPSAAWQFSLRDLFVRFTVVTALIAAWSVGIASLIRR